MHFFLLIILIKLFKEKETMERVYSRAKNARRSMIRASGMKPTTRLFKF